ncbi:MAG: YciI family protein [Candidatus Binatia bacterium]
MTEPKKDVMHAIPREQCYLCVMSLVANPPADAPPAADLRRAHKQFLGDLEEQGRIFGAGKLENSKEKEKATLGYGMFILRAENRKEAESIAFQEPNTKAGLRTMKLIPWQRTEGDINISINFTSSTVTIDRRRFLLETG